MSVALTNGFYVLFPIVIIYLCTTYPALDKIGMIIICYGVGLVLGNINLLPPEILSSQERLSEVCVALSLPLLLFSLDLKQWVHLAGKTILSMVFATISISIASCLGFLFINDLVKESWKLVGMAVAVYTGGTPNLAAIKTALQVDPTIFITFHTYDIVISLFCVIFFITIAQRVFNRFLPRFEIPNKPGQTTGKADDLHSEGIQSYQGMLNTPTLIKLSGALVLSALIVGGAVGISSLFPRDYGTSMTILLITSMGIGCSFIPAIRNIEKTFQLGMYIIMVFCLVVSSMSSFSQLTHLNTPVLMYVGFSVFGSLFLHAIFCKLFKIDTDTFIITSTSAICSPPFVPVVAAALRNKAVILSGLTTGIIGYAIGNYLGITMAYIVRSLG
ncbi:MAG: DUF819 family protein [Proteobacteria bacterium]|nr:DUF819 family protein [Pseudomonadota bacterium]